MSKESNDWWQKGLFLFLRLSAWIAAPVLAASFLGKWLDSKMGTEPWIFLATVALAFLISIFGLIKEAASEYKKIEENNKIKKDNGPRSNKQ